MEMSLELTSRQDLRQQWIQYVELLSMANAQLFDYLLDHLQKEKETGTGIFPLFTISKEMGVDRRLDVWVKGGGIFEASANYIDYTSLAGRGKGRNPKGVFGGIRWILQIREKVLKAITKFILEHQHGFLFENEDLQPCTQREAAKRIVEEYGEEFEIPSLDETILGRVVKNKRISIEGKEYFLSFFFTRWKGMHPYSFTKWLLPILLGENKRRPFSDKELSERLKKDKGIFLSRRCFTKYRESIGILSSRQRKQESKK